MKSPRLAPGALLLLVAPLLVHAQANFAELSLEQLLEIPVTSASRKDSTLGETAAAVTRLSGDEVLAFGSTTLADALRAVPGVHVAQITSSSWAISVRGFNNEYMNKLLVLIDGRPVYSTSFGGVFWNEQSLMLQDLDSIEVIRGPGGTLWGSNAMNGVVNITTKPVAETQGSIVTVDYGTENNAPTVSLRQGGAAGKDVFYRVWLKTNSADELRLPNGSEAADGWRDVSGGARLDWRRDPATDLTLEGSAYRGAEDWITPVTLVAIPGTPIPNELDYRGGHIRARAVHRQSADASLEAQASYSVSKHDTAGFTIDDRTLNLDLQQRFALGERHDIVAGAGYSTTDNRMLAGIARLDPDSATEAVASAFAQDEMTLSRTLKLTLGTKFEHNDVTGAEWQPGARLLWRPNARQSYWLAVSRALRTPSRLNRATYTAPGLGGPPGGNPIALVPDEVLATEVGARVEFSEHLSLDLALFFNKYDNMVTTRLLGPFIGPMGPYFQLVMNNALSADTYGGEATLSWQPLDTWCLKLSGSVVDIRPDIPSSIPDENATFLARASSTVRILPDLEWVAALGYTGEVAAYNVPAYLRLDTGLNWRISARFSAGLWLFNALDPVHPEFGNNTIPVLEAARSVHARLTWTF